MKLFIATVLAIGFSIQAQALQFKIQQNLNVDQLISKDNPAAGHFLLVRFMEDGSTTKEVQEPSCLLYVYTQGAATMIPAGTVLNIKSSNIDNPQDSSQAIFHKDRSVSIHADTGSEDKEFRVNCSDSALTYGGLKDFDLETINQYTGQFVTIE